MQSFTVRYVSVKTLYTGGYAAARDTALFSELGPRAFVELVVSSMRCLCLGCIADVDTHNLALVRWWKDDA